MADILVFPLFLIIPAILVRLESRVRIIRWLSPVFFCYALGILIGNITDLNPAWHDAVITVSVVLAIPILLLPSDVKAWLRLAPSTAISYALWLGIIMIVAWVVFNLLGDRVANPAQMAAMTASVYIGGTPNMAAVRLGIGAEESLFLEMTLSDFMLSGVYLIFIFTIAQRVLLLFLPAFVGKSTATVTETAAGFGSLSLQKKIIQITGAILMGGIIVGICAGISLGVWGKMNEIFVIIAITVLGLAASLFSHVRKWQGSYETGEYLFMIFCVAIGAKVDISLLAEGMSMTIVFMVGIAYGSVIVHALVARLFRIDADTVLITSVAGIFGPPFIGPVANSLNNREIVVSGMTLGVINLALGNFAGVLLYSFLT